MALPRASKSRKSTAIWTGGPTPPSPPKAPAEPEQPDSPAPPAARDPWHRRHPILLATFASLIAAALVLAILLPGESSNDRSRDLRDPAYASDCAFWWNCGGPVVHVNIEEYYTYLRLNVRPTLVSISASFVGAGCEASEAASSTEPAPTTEETLRPLRDARDTAREALKQAQKILPPTQLGAFHDRYQGVLSSTVAAVDAVESCAEGSQAGCDTAKDNVTALLTQTSGLAEEAKVLTRL